MIQQKIQCLHLQSQNIVIAVAITKFFSSSKYWYDLKPVDGFSVCDTKVKLALTDSLEKKRNPKTVLLDISAPPGLDSKIMW